MARTWPAAVGALVILWAPAWAWAQTDFLHLAPGPLSDAHAEWESPLGCLKCHDARGGRKSLSCFGCHEHDDLKRAISEGHGLHAKTDESCLTCHQEHKGRAGEVVIWVKVGGQTNFEHKRTGFELTGLHAKTKCINCHKQSPGAKHVSYVGLDADCDHCHKNPHQFTDAKLRAECTRCHVAGGLTAKEMTAAQIPFDHAAAAGIPLVGKHGKIACGKCHLKGKMSLDKRRRCVDCHKSSHGKVYVKLTCPECHDPVRAMAQVDFNHAAKTTFALAGKHDDVRCNKCHKDKDQKPGRACESCHQDPHRKRFAKFRCGDCHDTADTRVIGFEHGKQTKLALHARHARLSCRQCHRGKGPTDFERHESTDCRACHAHTDAHKHQFDAKACTDCHIEGGSKKLKFNHDKDSRFPLTGAHATLALEGDCKKCHGKGNYRSGKLTCNACHEDKHKGTLGDRCDRCHNTAVKFALIQFNHNAIAAFKIDGEHAKVECQKCHPAKAYKTGRLKCVDCHAEKEPHKGKLGPTCERCHPTAAKGAPAFVHESHTKFAREGTHLTVPCPFCHQAPPAAPPKVGWTKGVAPPPLDRTFPVIGKKCAECHADNHQGRYGAACQTCHRTSAFKDVSATTHDTGIFRLYGVHRTLPCNRCHTAQRLLAGLGEVCATCHIDDDRHHNGLGPFCGDCHLQIEWKQTRFSHTATGFPLKGRHRRLECDSCHGIGTYQGTPTDCEICHAADAARVADPLHTAELRPCDRCHTETAFVPARRSHLEFPLVGRHNFVRCKNCHGQGVYLGTPDTCAGCHMAAYLDPATVPNHVSSGYPATCEDCHSPVGWSVIHGAVPP
ncbi:MAG: hypothetical protein HY903_22435 [Deltaproteobacteria bacterium]|nr:hypothetical protein [Deltaproteobacteria bacterium]